MRCRSWIWYSGRWTAFAIRWSDLTPNSNERHLTRDFGSGFLSLVQRSYVGKRLDVFLVLVTALSYLSAVLVGVSRENRLATNIGMHVMPGKSGFNWAKYGIFLFAPIPGASP